MLLGRLWDAINDPLIGLLSDATPDSSRWGRRYPWLLICAIPLGLACALQWWVPPLQSTGLLAYYGGVSIFVFGLFTAVQIPFTALAAELTQGYDERTQIMSFKSAFNILGSIVGLLIAQTIFGLVESVRSQYTLLGVVLGGLVIVGLALACLGTLPYYRQLKRQRSATQVSLEPSVADDKSSPDKSFPRRGLLWQMRSLLRNKPFCWLVGLYLCSWVGIQTTAAVLPYFVTGWMQLPEQHFIQMALTVQVASICAVPIWSYLGQRSSKQHIYLLGAPLAIVGLLGLFFLRPGQVLWMYGWGILLGLGISTFYLVPFALLPDVIYVDAVQYPDLPSQEGLFTSVMVFLQKLALAISLFTVTLLLEGSGWRSGVATPIAQPASALFAIRSIMGPLPALVILGGMLCSWYYPLTRQQHDTIARRRSQQNSNAK
ncbi:MAG: MFS transporter [Phormidesmis sp.]